MTVPKSDPDLLAAAKTGDRRALDALLAREAPRVYRFALRMCRQPQDAQDVTQDALLAAARTLPGFRGDSAVSTWLYGIARSFCIKQRRRRKFAPTHVESLQEGGPGPQVADPGRQQDEVLAGHELEQALDAAIAALEPKYREVLVLRDVEGLPAAEVAAALGLQVAAVKSRLHRARVAVRERLAPWLEADAAPATDSPACPEVPALFSRYLEGEIGAETCAEMQRHLDACPRCRGTCAGLKRTLALCRQAGDAEVPATTLQAVRSALGRVLAAGG